MIKNVDDADVQLIHIYAGSNIFNQGSTFSRINKRREGSFWLNFWQAVKRDFI